MSAKKIIMIIIELFLVALAAIFVYRYVNEQVTPIDVYVYANDIQYDEDNPHQLSQDDVVKKTIVLSAKQDYMITDDNIADVIGKYVATNVYKEEYIMAEHLMDDSSYVNPLDALGTDYRKVTISTDYLSSFAGEIEAGDRVDLVFQGSATATDQTTGESYSYTYSKVFMQNVLIYEVYTGDAYKYTPHYNAEDQYTLNTFNGELSGDEETSDSSPSMVTFAVSMDDALEILTRVRTGSITMLGHFANSEETLSAGFIWGEFNPLARVMMCYENAEVFGLTYDEIQAKLADENARIFVRGGTQQERTDYYSELSENEQEVFDLALKLLDLPNGVDSYISYDSEKLAEWANEAGVVLISPKTWPSVICDTTDEEHIFDTLEKAYYREDAEENGEDVSDPYDNSVDNATSETAYVRGGSADDRSAYVSSLLDTDADLYDRFDTALTTLGLKGGVEAYATATTDSLTEWAESVGVELVSPYTWPEILGSSEDAILGIDTKAATIAKNQDIKTFKVTKDSDASFDVETTTIDETEEADDAA